MRILVLSHGARFEGAPRSLRDIVRYIHEHSDHELATAFATDGPLRTDFAECGPTMVVPRVWPHRLHRRLPGIGPVVRAGVDRATGLWLRRLGNPDVVLSNTVTNARLHRAIAPTGVPVITRVAELDHACAQVPEEDLAFVLRHSVGFLAGSGAVHEMLTERMGVDPALVAVVPGAIDVSAPPPSQVEVGEWRASVGIGADEVIVGGVGRFDWWKGADLFVPMAIAAARSDDRLRFVWMGVADAGERTAMLAAAEDAGLGDRMLVLPPSPSARTFLAAIDVLALLSREEAFGLVMLEAADGGVPTVCFAGVGGSLEFVGPDTGMVVPHLDVEAFAAAVVELAADSQRRERLGARARRELCHERHTTEVVGAAVLGVLERTARGAGRR